MKTLLKIFIAAILLCTLLTGAIYVNILYFGKVSTPEKSDTIIVLGCQIWGRSPSWSLEYRLQKALELYKDGYAPYIIVSGGQGKDEVTSESEVMKAWLVTHGIEDTRIIEENKSTSTYENIKYSKEIMNEKGFQSALIVSNDFHIFRSLRTAKIVGIEASAAPAPTVEHLKLYYRSREILAVVKSFLTTR